MRRHAQRLSRRMAGRHQRIDRFPVAPELGQCRRRLEVQSSGVDRPSPCDDDGDKAHEFLTKIGAVERREHRSRIGEVIEIDGVPHVITAEGHEK
jgi:ribosome maturation factor RimP